MPRTRAPAEITAYLDHNATAPMSQEALAAYARWANRGDPSASYASAQEARRFEERFRKYIAETCDFDLEGPHGYTVVFTSGREENNCHILTAAARAYTHKVKRMPHLVVAAAEDPSTLSCAARLSKERLAELSLVPPEDGGGTSPQALSQHLNPNTCLACVCAAHPDTGAINDLRSLGQVLREDRHPEGRQVPLYVDVSLFFGRSVFRPADLGVDAFGGAFHYLGGPPGVGFLGIRNSLLEGYDFPPLIHGAPHELRGGVANTPGLAASFAALKLALADRGKKNERIGRLRGALEEALSARLPACELNDYLRALRTPPPEEAAPLAARVRRTAKRGVPHLVWIRPGVQARTLPGTLTFAVLLPGFDAEDARKALEDRGILVGVVPRRVGTALGLPKGSLEILRVSLGDSTAAEEVRALANTLPEILGAPPGLDAEK